MEKPKSAKTKATMPPASPSGAKTPLPPAPPLFRRLDWIVFGIVTLLILIGYVLTLAPNLTLEDSGELAVGSYYAGVPHPPGYPVWTLYTWLFTALVPFSNIAWRVALSSAVAGAFSCGLLALLVSRGSSMLLEGIDELRGIDRRWESWICAVAGSVSGLVFGFNGFVWSQAVIVEVYTFSVLSFMGVLCLLLRWIYAPHQRRYLYWAMFIFGICMTNHQTLIVAAMGIEVAILAAQPRLGRDLFVANSLIYVIGLAGIAAGKITTFDNNVPLFVIYNLIGAGSMAVAAWYTFPAKSPLRTVGSGAYFIGWAALWLFWLMAVNKKEVNLPISILKFQVFYVLLGFGALIWFSWTQPKTDGIGLEWKAVLIMGGLWLLGTFFYFYMPVASMTNPPMNWGYPRTVEGFFHALTRGQYDKTNPTSDPFRFFGQIWMYYEGAASEFGLVSLLIGLLPFVLIHRMQKRERAWLVGLTATYLCLSGLLLMLLNPQTDRQSQDQVRVFFTFSHVIIAIAIGYGITLIGGWVTTQYERTRQWLWVGGAVAMGIQFYGLVDTIHDTKFTLLRLAAVIGLCLAGAFTAAILSARRRGPTIAVMLILALLPMRSIFSNWADNEQRGHLFGYWFGHDMFKPPFGIYPDMAKDAILFGGTDPGRFCPTYMIFNESFTPPSKKLDPEFDRRDVYIITQNALADGTYLEYIRAQYNRSAQIDPPFFSELFHTKLFMPLDRFFMNLGARIEKQRRERGVYPPEEIHTPTAAESEQAFAEYINDAQRRLEHDVRFPNEPKQIKPGEEVHPFIDAQGQPRVQVAGQIAVMSINGLLTKVIFDQNPGHEFYVEESFPLDWMFPYLTPFGIIMKINRQPVAEITDDMVQKDHEFWSRYSERLIGNWITYDTPVKDICEWAERTYLHRDFTGFNGSRKFVRDKVAQKSFSKLRSAIGGLYTWHLNPAVSKGAAEQERILKEADFALRQSFAFCPYSPEAVYKYASLLATTSRYDDALLVVRTAKKFDPESTNLNQLEQSLEYMKQAQPAINRMQGEFNQLEQDVASNPTNLTSMVALLPTYLQLGRTNEVTDLIDKIVNSTNASAAELLPAAQYAYQLGDLQRFGVAIRKLGSEIPNLRAQFEAQTNNVTLAFRLVSSYLMSQQTNQAEELLDRIMSNPNADATTLLSAAQAYAQLHQGAKLESALKRLLVLMPRHAEAWYDLATVQSSLGKIQDGLSSLSQALKLSDERRAAQPQAKDLRAMAVTDARLAALRADPGFAKLVR